jgi:hypothetical protein
MASICIGEWDWESPSTRLDVNATNVVRNVGVLVDAQDDVVYIVIADDVVRGRDIVELVAAHATHAAHATANNIYIE